MRVVWIVIVYTRALSVGMQVKKRIVRVYASADAAGKYARRKNDSPFSQAFILKRSVCD